MSEQAQVPDGLLALQNKREAAKRPSNLRRTLRPPQNPNKLPPYQAPQVADGGDRGEAAEPPAPVPEPIAAVQPAPVAAVQPAKPRPQPAKDSSPAPAKDSSPAPIVRVTSYIDESQDAYLDDVKFVGVRRRTKIDVSRAAVVRFALEQLMADMTPEQVYEAIAAKPVDTKATGRKRR